MHKTGRRDSLEVKMETALIHAFERALQHWLEGECALHGDHAEQGWDGRMHMDLCGDCKMLAGYAQATLNPSFLFHPFHEHPHLAGDIFLDEVRF